MVLKLAPRTFRGQMALLFGLLSVLVGLPTYWYISSQHRAQLIKNKREALVAVSHSAATLLTESLAERHREIALLAQTPLYRQAALNDPEVHASLDRVKRSYTHYSWIGVTDVSGNVQAATSGHLVGADVSQRPWFQAGLKGSFVGDIHEALLLAKLLPGSSPDQTIRFIDFSTPILDDTGQIRGVLGAHAHWQWAGDLLATITPPETAAAIELFILNHGGEVIYPESPPEGLKVPKLETLAGSSGQPFLDWGENVLYLAASSAVQTPEGSTALGWQIIARQTEDAVLAEVRSLQRVNLFTMLLACVAFLVLARVVAQRISRPVETLTQAARRIERGERPVRFSETFWARELQRLADALRGMSSTLIQQKEALAQSNQDLEAKVARRTAELQRLNIELEKLAHTDALTGLANRLRTNERLAQEFARFKRSGTAYSVLVMDIDFFKHVNDTYGHAVGDQVLRHVAATLQATVRKTDFVGRIGGEEFLIILPMTSDSQAQEVAEKVRLAIADSPMPPVGSITTSIGIQQVCADDANEEVAVTRADAWL